MHVTSNKAIALAITIGKQSDILRFRYGWKYVHVAEYMMKKFDIDLATLDELLRLSEENDLVRENVKVIRSMNPDNYNRRHI